MRNAGAIAAAMSDRELYSFFDEEKFYGDPELTRAVCQEVENREAALAGRPPATVRFEDLGTKNGYSGGGIIGIHEKFLKPNLKRSPGEILNTILHEGRHEWQTWMLNNHPEALPEKTMLQLTVNETCYQPYDPESALETGMADKNAQAWIEYAMQENEVDARFYAICKMKEIASGYDLNELFDLSIEKAMDEEVLSMEMLRNNMDEEQYRLLEKLTRERYEEFEDVSPLYTELPEGFECYDSIRMMMDVVFPAFETLTDLTGGIYKELSGAALLYALYEEARMNMMSGNPLENPEKLIAIMLSDDDFKAEFRIDDQEMPDGLKAKIRM